jgi:hypothetical protein
MNDTLTFTGELQIVTCWCGMKHAVPSGLYKHQEREKDAGRSMSIFCPLGHEWTRGGLTEAERLRRQLENEQTLRIRERQAHDQTRATLRDTELSRRAERGAKTRIKNRISKGACPCCNRYFKDLHRHIQGQHPDYVTQD